MRKLLAVMAASSLLAACGDKGKAPASGAQPEAVAAKRAAPPAEASKPGKKVEKAKRLAKNAPRRGAKERSYRDERDEEGFRSPPMILLQSPPSDY